MFIDLTDSQRALQAELRRYFSTLISPEEAKIMRVERHGPTYREVIRRMGKDGWLGVGWPKEYGGKDFTAIENYIFFNESQAAGCPIPFSAEAGMARCRSMVATLVAIVARRLTESPSMFVMEKLIGCAIGATTNRSFTVTGRTVSR